MSPSLVYQKDFSDPLPEGFNTIYMRLLEEDHNNKVVDDDNHDTELNKILIQASQLYEASKSEGTLRLETKYPTSRHLPLSEIFH